MLFRKETLKGIKAGRVTLAFRRWKRAGVREGGTLLTRAGQLAIVSVRRVKERAITEAEAKKAGETREELLKQLAKYGEGELYRIQFRLLGEDPRIALRKKSKIPAVELDSLLRRLKKLDASSSFGAWTLPTLQAIADNPGRRAPDLAASFGRETKPFKIAVRKLKALGLTESLIVGYRISPRGRTALKALRRS